jgi:calcineurin-like phosphoesterase family protein
MTIFFTADQHFSHQNILKFCDRPWQWYGEMDEALIEKFNKVVTDEDIVWHLGDLCWKTDPANFISRLKGKEHHLILGNHDNEDKCRKVFTSVQHVKLLNIKGYPNIWLSHYAHRVWPASHYGSIHLFGHSHGNLTINPGDKCMDVGVDNCFYYPINIEAISLLLNPDIKKD